MTTKRAARLALLFSIQLIAVGFLLEIGLRLLARFDSAIQPLLYNPFILGRYERVDTLEGLFATRPKGFRPNSEHGGFVLNSRSFQDREYSDAKPSETRRILLIGDSFTAANGGIPYPQHWGVLLEQQLRERLSSDAIEVLKLGVGGVGPRFELRLWQLEGSRLSADWVVLAFCIGNDFTDEQLARQGLAEQIVARSYALRLLRNLERLRGAVDAEEILVGAGGYATTDRPYDPQRPSFSDPAYWKLVGARMAITQRSRREWFEQLFDALKPVLTLFHDSVTKAGARPLFLLIPDEYQVDPSLLHAVAAHEARSADAYDFDLPQRELAAWFDRHDMQYVDLLPAFRDAGASVTLYKLRDTHWNADGNRLAAQELSRYLAAHMEAPTRVSSRGSRDDH